MNKNRKTDVKLVCPVCKITFFKEKKYYNQNKKLGYNHHCTKKCADKDKIINQQVVCKQCGTSFPKHPNQIKKSPNHFCNSSCAATYNNKKYPKRISKYKCIDCHNKITHSTCGRCHKCRRLFNLKSYNERTIKEALYKNGDASLKFNAIRTRARSVLELEGRPKVCEGCGWDKHVHVAHIKAISSFDLDAKIKIVNASSNLKYLCPNCHWIFDHS